MYFRLVPGEGTEWAGTQRLVSGPTYKQTSSITISLTINLIILINAWCLIVTYAAENIHR